VGVQGEDREVPLYLNPSRSTARGQCEMRPQKRKETGTRGDGLISQLIRAFLKKMPTSQSSSPKLRCACVLARFSSVSTLRVCARSG